MATSADSHRISISGLTRALIAYEQGELDEQETVELFQGLLDSGLVWHLQGHYGRQCVALIDAGLLITNRRPNGR